MSKLARLIRKTGQVEPAPLGFGAGPRKRTPTLLIIALVPERWQKNVDEAADAGADGFLLTGKPGDSDLADAVSAADDRPCGLALAQPAAADLARAREAKIDFLLVGADAPASLLSDDDLGAMLHLKEELTDIQLRVLEGMDFDGIYLEQQAGALTIRQQMDLKRVSGLARKPLLLHARANADADDLASLRDSGAPLLAVDMKERDATDTIRKLRGVIDTMPARKPPRRDDRPDVTLPRAAAREVAEDDDEGEGAAEAPRTPRRPR